MLRIGGDRVRCYSQGAAALLLSERQPTAPRLGELRLHLVQASTESVRCQMRRSWLEDAADVPPVVDHVVIVRSQLPDLRLLAWRRTSGPPMSSVLTAGS